MTIPGTDGQKMSKSYGNIIDVFAPEKELLKAVKSIISDSTPLEAPKDPSKDVTFKLYALLASPEETADMRQRYEAGGYGYGHAKQALYELILRRFGPERERFNFYMDNLPELDAALALGAQRAQDYGAGVLAKVRQKVGYGRA
jgi:tryptophanyl-tRNA synthetase